MSKRDGRVLKSYDLSDVRSRLEEKIFHSPDGCWYWTGAADSKGYGVFGRTISFREPKIYKAHRVFYELFKGEIPDGLLVCHTCDNRLCCNPQHLFLGTAQDNTDDMFSKGRASTPRLTVNDVSEIRSSAKGTTKKRLADKFNVSVRNIYKIINGETWRNAINEQR